MEFLAIQGDSLVSNFIDRYQIWKDVKNFYNNKTDPYLIYSSEYGIPCFHYDDIDSINNSDSTIIAINCLTEGIHKKSHFIQYRSDRHYIFFSNGWWNKDKHPLPYDYTLIDHLFFLFDMCDTYNSPNRFSYYADREYKFDYPKPYVFVSTIGNVRPERDQLVEQLLKKINYQNFILRYSGQDLAMPANEFDIITFQPGEFDPYTNILEKHYHNVSRSLPIQMHNQGYFNLIVETDLVEEHEFFLTEKTIKSLITGQPFVIVSTEGFLNHLQQLGFKTYSSIWNEDYDQEYDFNTRITKVVDLCNQLNTLDWAQYQDELDKIGHHNRNLFNHLQNIADREFLKLESLIQNF